MKTDITELAQSMKAAAEKASNGDWVKESGDGWDATCSNDDQANGGFIIAHFEGPDATANREFIQAANPANILALVETLEKAQRANAAQDDHINQQQDRIEQLEKKNAELGKYAGGLESFRTAYMEWSDKTDWVNTDRRFGVVKPLGKHRADVLKEYIEHLESRTVTVKLPKKNIGWDRDEDDCWNNAIDACAEALTAAGIKWEAE